MSKEKEHILVVQPLMDALANRLASRFICHNLYQCENSDEYLRQHGEKIRGVATRGDVGLSADVMARLPRLEIISVFGVGTDGIDLVKADERGINVTVTRDILTDDVADLALAFILAQARQLSDQDKFARSGQWLTTPPRHANKVSGKKIGILGLGKIGKAIAKRASAFDMCVGYCDRTVKSSVEYSYFPNAQALAAFSDFLVLAMPGNESNRNLIDSAVLQALGPEGTLINIARGSLVNEQHLIEALQSGAIKAAALDVYQHEPEIPAPLLQMNNVLLTPHIASATVETRQAMANNVFDNLERYFTEGKAITALDLQ